MDDRLQRLRALIGGAAVEKLRAATVMVVGVGAVGSFAAEALARSGVGHLILIDFDRVEMSNINRQLFAVTSTVGMPKVAAAAARIRDINPDICLDAMDLRFDGETDIDVAPDFVIDAIDMVDSKIALYKWCAARQIPFIASMGAARKHDISKIRIDNISRTSVCPLAARVRKIVRTDGISDFPAVFSVEPACALGDGDALGSIVTVTGTFGLMLAGFVIAKIAGSDVLP